MSKKGKKVKKGKKRVSKPRGLPTAVRGLLQYLGGQDATLQQTPRPRGAATGADGGETLNRYLAAKTASLDAMRQASLGVNIAQQAEEKLLAKRQAEEAEKKISLLSAGLKESDTQRQKAVSEQKRKIAELESVVRQQGVETLFRGIQQQKMEREKLGLGSYMGSLSGSTPSRGSGNSPSGNAPMSEFSAYSESGVGGMGGGGMGESEHEEEGEVSSMGGSAASEMYRQNAPLDRPIIRDRPRAGGGGGAAASYRLPKRIVAPKAPSPEKASTNISAAELKSRIKEVTGLARSRYKLPSRAKYGGVQAALGNLSASSADIISALKEAGVNIAEA
jgi:hypothetical protein